MPDACAACRCDRGEISADIVVLCAGMWSRQLARSAGVNVPLHAAEHFYVVTEPVPGLDDHHLPTLRDLDGCLYCRGETGGKLLVGFFEPVAKPWGMDGIPEGFAFRSLAEDWKHLEPQLEAMLHRVPALENVGIQLFFNGPESFTPDDRYLVGEAPETDGLFVAAGFNSIGIQSAGGVGKLLSDWIVRRCSANGSLGRRHRSHDALPEQPELPARPHQGGARPALRHALAAPSVGDRTTRSHLAAARSTGGSRSLLR